MIRTVAQLIVLILVLIPRTSLASTTPAELRSLLAAPIAQMQSAQTLRGAFLQSKQLSGFPQALTSSGDFLFVRDERNFSGIVWRTLQPIQSEFVLDTHGIQVRGGGALPQSGNQSGSQSAYKPVSAVFIALFGLDLDTLARLFDMTATVTGKAWQLTLVPRDPAMAKVTPMLVLHGEEKIERIEFSDALGDRTEIRLSAVHADRAAPTAEDLARFKR